MHLRENKFLSKKRLINLDKNDKLKGDLEVMSLPDNSDVTLIVNHRLIDFQTDEQLFINGRSNIPEAYKDNNFYKKRYYYFSLFDKGIQMDDESWYSVTPEELSEYISSIIPNSNSSNILDGFCGCGGNVIHFSKRFKTVYANDLYESKINLTKNNTSIYECEANIIYSTGDFLKFDTKVDYIFLSPPWGGPEYINDENFSLKKWITPDIEDIIKHSLNLSKNIIFYIPRNTDLIELSNYLYKYDLKNIEDYHNTIMLDARYLHSAGKNKALLVCYGDAFNSVKIKDIKMYVNNIVKNKRDNTPNNYRNLTNIIKCIGYNKFLKNVLQFKSSNCNISLVKIINYFLGQILNEEELSQYNALQSEMSIKNDIKVIDIEDIYDISKPLSSILFNEILKKYQTI